MIINLRYFVVAVRLRWPAAWGFEVAKYLKSCCEICYGGRWCLGTALIEITCSRRAPGCLTLIGDESPPTTGRSEGLRWCLSSSPSRFVVLFIQDEAMDVAVSAPQGSHYHVDGI